MMCDFLSGGNGSLVKGSSTSVTDDEGQSVAGIFLKLAVSVSDWRRTPDYVILTCG